MVSTKDSAQIEDLNNQGLSYSEIAAEIGYSLGKTISTFRSLGIKKNVASSGKEPIYKTWDIRKCQNMANLGQTWDQIGRSLGCSGNTARRGFAKLGIRKVTLTQPRQ